MTEPLRILRVIARLNIGGPAIHVTLLSHFLKEPEWESLLAAGRIDEAEGDMGYLAEQYGVRVQTIDELGPAIAPVRDLRSLWQLYRLMREFRPHVVHTHTAKAGFIGRVAAWLARVPVRVHTFHGHVFHGYFGPLKTFVFLTMERIAAFLSDRILTLTESLREELAAKYRVCPKSKIQVLSLGLDLDRFLNQPRHQGGFRKSLGIEKNVPLVGIVGRLVPIKNHELFLQAASLIAESRPETTFAIIGDGELRETLEQRVGELSLDNNVRFLGWQRDLHRVYSDLDTLVLSSDNEGTPVSIIEALTAGCPVVSTQVGGVGELLQQGERGRLTPAGEPAPLCQAVLESLQDEVPMSVREEMNLSFGIRRLVEDLSNLYHELLTRKGHS